MVLTVGFAFQQPVRFKGLTVKDLITTSNIHDLKVICGKEEMNREIKGIKIIEVENIEKYLREGELILASFLVYQDCTSSQFEEHLKKFYN